MLAGVNDMPTPDRDARASRPPLLSQTTKIVGLIGVFALLATGILAWGQSRNTTETAAAPAQTRPSATPTQRESGSAVQDPTKPSANPSAKPTGPPEVVLDWIDYSPPSCDETRAIGVNVLESRGEVEEVTLVWRAKEFDAENSRRLFKTDGQWTAYVRDIPSDTPVQLLAIAKGPGGETTLAADVSRYC